MIGSQYNGFNENTKELFNSKAFAKDNKLIWILIDILFLLLGLVAEAVYLGIAFGLGLQLDIGAIVIFALISVIGIVLLLVHSLKKW